MKYILESTGEEVEVPDDPQEQALARAAGLVPAARVEAGKGTTLQALGEGAERVAGSVAEGIQRATGFGTAPGLDEDDQGHKLPGGGLLQDAYSPEARLRREAHPIAAGIGTGLAAAPAAGLAAAGGALLAPGAIPLIGGTLGGIVTEAGVQAAAQEYDDAWLEQRPMALQQVAAKTLMFAGADMLFRGAFAGGKRLLFGAAPETGGLGRNLVSEAQGAARESSPYAKPGASVGAAHAEDLSEPFDDAISSMSDKDAAVLARDSEDHLHLVSQHASEEFTRVNQGLTDNLGTKLKYENFAKNAADWDAPLLERQAGWLDSVHEQGDAVAREVASFAEGKPEAIDFGNLGKKAAKVIDDYNRRIVQETDPARRNLLTDNVKKQLDSVTMSIDASHGVDAVTRGDLKALIAPYREELRTGLQNPKYWGKNAKVQQALNAPWHQFLEHWPKVQQQVLEATGHVAFDTAGAGRITRESTVDRMLSLLGKDPRSNQEFGKHLAGALDGLNGLIEASQKHGITDNASLEAMAGDVRNLMEDWNLGTTVGVAKNRVAIMQRDPRKWARIALDFGERLPLGVGKTIETVRHLGSAMNDLHLQKDTPLAAVWDRAYQRFAQNPALKDPSIARNYADWVIDSLNRRGGAIPPPAGAMGAPSAAAMNDVMTGSPGFGQAAQPEAGSIFSPGPSPGAQRVRAILERRRGQEGSADFSFLQKAPKPTAQKLVESGGDPFAEDIGGGGGTSTAGSFYRGSDGVERYAKFHGDPEMAMNEAATANVYRDFGVRVPSLEVVAQKASSEAENRAAGWGDMSSLPNDQKVLLSERLPPDWKPIDKFTAAQVTPEAAREYVRGVPADIVLGNWDLWQNPNPGNLFSNGSGVLRLDVGEAGPRVLSPSGSKLFQMQKPIEKELMWERFARSVEQHPATFLNNPGQLPSSSMGASTLSDVKADLVEGVKGIQAALDKAGGSQKFVAERYPHLPSEQRSNFADAIEARLRFVKRNVDKIAGMAIGAGVAFGHEAQAHAAPPPQMPPEAAYREAMTDIAKGGDAHLTALATSALRKRAPGAKGKSPLELFAGSRSIEDAVEQTRQALGKDPSELVKMLGGAVGDLWKTHPGVYGAVVQKAHQLQTYLQQNWPQPTATTLLDPRGGKLSFDRAWDCAARFVGAAQPKTALREVARGTAAPEMIASVRENWPELWEPFRAEMLGQIQRRAAAGRHVPSERLRRLDTMLGMDGQLDPSASLAVAAHFLQAQDAEAQKRQQAGQSSGSKALSNPSASSMRTRLDAINSERSAQ
jgi:hypothetical protein